MRAGEQVKSKQFGEIEITEIFSSEKDMKGAGYNLSVNDAKTAWQVNYKILSEQNGLSFAAAPKKSEHGFRVRFERWISRNYNQILITILAGFAVYVLLKNVNILSTIVSTENISADAIASAYQGTLLSNGLTIIAIAIAIWAGLSITNAVARKDVMFLQRKTERLQEAERKIKDDLQTAQNDTKSVQASASNLRTDITNLTNQQSSLVTAFMSAFKSELLKTKSDVATLKIYKDFDRMAFDNSNMAKLLQKMIIVEQLFAFVYANHTSHQKYGYEIISQADMAIAEINALQEDPFISSGADKNAYMIARYLEYRHAELLFYKGYALTGDEKTDAYKTAIDLYKKSWWLITAPKADDITPPDNNTTSSFCVTNQDAEETVELKLYLLNTILESYNKWATSLIHQKKAKDVDILYQESRSVITECQKALSILEEKESSQLRLSEVYYRNLGCYYSTINKAMPDSFSESDILTLFEKAFRLAIDDDNHVLPYRVDNIYYVLVQHLFGMIRRRLKFSDAGELQLTDYAAGFHDIHIFQRKLYKILCSAQKDIPRRRLYYSVHGLLCVQIVAEKKMDGNTSCFEGSIDFYISQAKADLDFLNYTFSSQTKPDQYTKDLDKYLSILNKPA